MSDLPIWSPTSWKSRPAAQAVAYRDLDALSAACERLSQFPPLVTSFEVERLKSLLADAQRGDRFVLQGGDCAETLADCRPDSIAKKLKILLQMSMVLVHGRECPVVRIGRFAGQYAKPRSKPMETRDGVSLPNFFGDLINRPEFEEDARAADPGLLIEGYKHAAMTLNFIRSLSDAGFADLHHPEYWDLSFMESATLSPKLKAQYLDTTGRVQAALRFMRALSGDAETSDELSRVEFFTSHEGLNLHYESAQTRRVPRRESWYDLTTHMPWIGERTRGLAGAHVEFFRGIANPIGIKIGPTASSEDVVALLDVLDPKREPGKIVLITRMGAKVVRDRLPALLKGVHSTGRPVLWMSDPMHGNSQTTTTGLKTRNFDAILDELEGVRECHETAGTYFGGVHFELTGDDVTECTGGAENITEQDLTRNYATACDPRLNYRQALEMTFRITPKQAE